LVRTSASGAQAEAVHRPAGVGLSPRRAGNARFKAPRLAFGPTPAGRVPSWPGAETARPVMDGPSARPGWVPGRQRPGLPSWRRGPLSRRVVARGRPTPSRAARVRRLTRSPFAPDSTTRLAPSLGRWRLERV